ncbi:MAG: thiaminase II [Candidatus Glassbacteria bacterium]|nr:thiaminase II [Candidatus Glassbacteria bacterium]
MSFSEQLAVSCGEKWERMHTHPFVKEIGLGTLPKDKYRFYLEQDYIYLIEFCRLLGLLASKAPDLETMGKFKDLLALTLEYEMDLHVRTCAEFGVDRQQLEKVKPAPFCLAYTSYLLNTAGAGEFADGVVALLPCAWGYYEVGRRLAERGLPEEQCYREWIETYSSAEMAELVAYLRGLTDSFGAEATEAGKKRWSEIFERSVEFEIMFWEMGYHKLTEAAGLS